MASSAILFDGTTDFMTRGPALDGVVNSKIGIFSCWIRIDGGDSTGRNFFVTGIENVRFRFQSDNDLQFRFKNGNPSVVFRSSITLTTDPAYFHVLASWDAGNNIVQLYIDDVDRTEQEPPNPTIDFNLGYTIFDWAVGADISGNFKFEGAIFDFYFQPGEFLDFSVEANRRKFRTDGGNPVDLGANGQLPTGTSPAVYLPGDQTNQALNEGTGGDFASQATQVPGETPGPVVSTASYVPDAILFDGTTDFMLRTDNLTGVVDGKQGTFSCWLRLDDIDLIGRDTVFATDPLNTFIIQFLESNAIRVNARNSVSSVVLRLDTTNVLVVVDVYIHLLASWDLSAGIGLVYLDDVQETLATETTVDDFINYNSDTPGWAVGTQIEVNFYEGAMSDLYFTTEFLDISLEANRRKFIDVDGDPVFLGDTGERPTGTAAIVYLRGNQTDQGANTGTGGDFVSQATQVPGETSGPVEPLSSVEAILAGVGSFQASAFSNFALSTLPGVGGFQAEGDTDDGAYVPKAILFDGTTDFMTRFGPLDGISDSKLGLVNLWFRIDGGNNTRRALFGDQFNALNLELTNENKLVLVNVNSILVLIHDVNLQPGPTWYHYFASWDVGSGTASAYLDGVIQTSKITSDNDILYSIFTDWTVGARAFAGTLLFTGAIAEYYFTTEFLDLDVRINRFKFVDSNGDPVFLGTTGERPTGTSAFIYLRGELTDQGVNAGTGGDFVSQATQVPNETTGPVDDAIATLLGAGELQLDVIITTVNTTLPGVGSLQASGASITSPNATLDGVGGFQANGTDTVFMEAITLPGTGGFQAEGATGNITSATLAGVGGFQAEGFSQGQVGATLTGVGGFQAIATIVGAVTEATLAGVGGFDAQAVTQDFGVPDEEVLVCDPALDTSSPGSGSLPRNWNGL